MPSHQAPTSHVWRCVGDARDPEPCSTAGGSEEHGALPEGMEKWTIVRWHKAPDMDKPFRCGPLSKMNHIIELLGKSPPYGYPNRGGIGNLALYDTREDALKAIESGTFDGLDGFNPYASHTTEPLSSMRFKMSAGPYVIGEPEDVEYQGDYRECFLRYTSEVLADSDRDIKIEEVT